MNSESISIRNDEKENIDDAGDWPKIRTVAVLGNVREFFKQIRVQQQHFKKDRTRSMKPHQHDILNNLPLTEKIRLGLYHLMD